MDDSRKPIDENDYYSENEYYLGDPFEGEMMTVLIYLFSDLT